MDYAHAIENSVDGEIWQVTRLGDEPEEHDGTASEYGREVLEQWIADEYSDGAPTDEYGNPLLRVRVYPGDAEQDHAALLATVYPSTN